MQGNPGKWLLRDVSLQENNHIALVDLESASVIGDFPAGAVFLDQTDTVEEDPALISLTDLLFDVPREPDAVTWIGDDHITVRLGHYPDSRSENKGNEPEAIEYAEFGGTEYLFVGSERSSVVFVYALQGAVPELRQVLPTGVGPEGVLAIPSRGLLVVASEEDERDDIIRSQVSIYRLGGAATYPSIESVDRPDGTPIPWAALSGLVADPSAPDRQYTIYDSFYDRSRVFELDTGSTPARIAGEIELDDVSGLIAGLDFPKPTPTAVSPSIRRASLCAAVVGSGSPPKGPVPTTIPTGPSPATISSSARTAWAR